MTDLFQHAAMAQDGRIQIAQDAYLYPQAACKLEANFLDQLDAITAQAPFRHMHTPGGHQMSVAMTNCGDVGWVTDRQGYRYSDKDPQSGQPWPNIPPSWLALAQDLADQSGFASFAPDCCLINLYAPGARMGLHQDKDEANKTAPIVSISLGLPATFQFGGLKRSDPVTKHPLAHGDVVVWGGAARLAYHGVLTVRKGSHPLLGERRINLTFRQAR